MYQTLISLVPWYTTMKKDDKNNKDITLEDSFLTSRRAVQLLTVLEDNQLPNNATEIAKNQDLDRSTVSRILDKLSNRNLIYVSNREQAKYFQVDYQIMVGQSYNLIQNIDARTGNTETQVESSNILADYFQSKLQKISEREHEDLRYPTLRDLLLTAPATELEEYLKNVDTTEEAKLKLTTEYEEEFNKVIGETPQPKEKTY